MTRGRCLYGILLVLTGWITLILAFYTNTNQFQINPKFVNNALVQVKEHIGALSCLVGIKTSINTNATNTTATNISIINVHKPKGTALDDGCKGFYDTPTPSEKEKYFKRLKPLDCTNQRSPNFLYLSEDRNSLVVNSEKIKKLNALVKFCNYASLTRLNQSDDFHVTVSKWSNSFTKSISIPPHVSHIWGQCYDNNSNVVGTSYLSIIRKIPTLETQLKRDYKQHVKKHRLKETLSILMVGIDGTSKQNFARQMPKTKSFLLDKMGAIEFYKLNKVGLNTFPNVIPMLTGEDTKGIRKNWTDKEFLDKIDHLFIWEKARKAGYRTSLILDLTDVTSFHYMKKGWQCPKFHYYHRPVVVHLEANKLLSGKQNYCVADAVKTTAYYDYWLQLTKTFNNSKTTPYFGYSFFCHVTHNDVNRASTIDDVYLELFQNFLAQNSLNNTLIVFFGDHGTRFGPYRKTFHGMLEDNNPFVFFIFPPWFKSKYPKLIANLRHNQHRLMNNFDVHATLMDILYFQGEDVILSRKTPANRTRGLSLFKQLPVKRTCEEAGIPIKFCNCRYFTMDGITPEITTKVSEHFTKIIVEKSKSFRKECVALTLNSTDSIMTVVLSTGEAFYDIYQVTVKTWPGGAVYEATLKVKKDKKVKGRTTVVGAGSVSLEGDIQRVNMYRGQADCIKDARVQPFCYCRNLL